MNHFVLRWLPPVENSCPQHFGAQFLLVAVKYLIIRNGVCFGHE